MALSKLLEKLSINTPSPIQELEDFHKDYKVFIKREELIHESFGGNKWRKLKYNIENYYKGGYSHIVSFGGAFSNHISALANLTYELNIPTIGIIRGEIDDLDNPTLKNARQKAMVLKAINRSEYRLKEESSAVKEILMPLDNPLLIPEGGSNVYAKEGIKELALEIGGDFDHVLVAAGTGMTAVGLLENMKSKAKLWVIATLRDNSLIEKLRRCNSSNAYCLNFDYHEGGYAKVTPQLIENYTSFYQNFNIPLDPIYNAKVLLALNDLIDKNAFEKGSKILMLNTGGLQGAHAYNYRFKNVWPI